MVSVTVSPVDALARAMPTPQLTPAYRPGKVAGIIRKREEYEAEDTLAPVPNAHPNKKVRVAFAADVEVRVMDGWEEGLSLVREEVRHAIEKHAMGDNEAYDRIIEIFSSDSEDEDGPSPKLITNHLVALLADVASLDRSCASLVHAVLRCQWLGRDDTFVALYIRFLGSLISAQGSYVGPVLKMVIENFSNLDPSTGDLLQYAPVRKTQLYARTHMALKYILQLVPAAVGAVCGFLASSFPHSSDSSKAHVDYVKNLLRILEYGPELKSEVISLITERLVKLDVQIQMDLDDLEDGIEDTLLLEVSTSGHNSAADDENSSEGSGSESDASDDSTNDENRRIKDVKANVKKVDALLGILFEFYEPSFAEPSSAESEDSFGQLLTLFLTTILPTYRSRHVQFLLFHYAQKSQELIGKFAGACFQIAADRSRPRILRSSAAAYLGSFIARGAQVSAEVVRDVFDIIGRYLNEVRLTSESSCQGPDLTRFGTYYSMFQALLYIFCFRWRDLVARNDEEPEDETSNNLDDTEFAFAPGFKETFTSNIYSRFNPLKVCSPSIVNEFARIANHLRFVYVYPLLEKNKRLRLTRTYASTLGTSTLNQPNRESALSMRNDETLLQLDAYFPFDPYELPLTKRWIEADYVQWRGIPGLDDVERSESESDLDEDDEDSVVGEDGSEAGSDST